MLGRLTSRVGVRCCTLSPLCPPPPPFGPPQPPLQRKGGHGGQKGRAGTGDKAREGQEGRGACLPASQKDRNGLGGRSSPPSVGGGVDAGARQEPPPG